MDLTLENHRMQQVGAWDCFGPIYEVQKSYLMKI